MQEAVVSPLTAWQNFYVIVGSAAAALTGLTFVMATLVAEARISRTSESVAAFGTPTVVHFGVVILVAALLCAPWQALWQIGLLLGLCGMGGIIYVLIVLRRARRQSTYRPVLEDWLWHILFPFISYAVFVVAAVLLPVSPTPTLFGVGAALMLFLFIGIHNSWDTVTYVTIQSSGLEQERPD